MYAEDILYIIRHTLDAVHYRFEESLTDKQMKELIDEIFYKHIPLIAEKRNAT